ncbi:ferredoxin [Nocardia sp. NBC_01377]|uniref:ferredoxin n=1 Tax=Nocardia TaxID=1817 RepID=UPI001C213D77|nr:ferredoxin [Nocardia noduli]
MKVIVDWGLCDGNGVCAIEAPTVFEIDDDDELQLLKDEISDVERGAVDSAIRVCPKRALRLES